MENDGIRWNGRIGSFRTYGSMIFVSSCETFLPVNPIRGACAICGYHLELHALFLALHDSILSVTSYITTIKADFFALSASFMICFFCFFLAWGLSRFSSCFINANSLASSSLAIRALHFSSI